MRFPGPRALAFCLLVMFPVVFPFSAARLSAQKEEQKLEKIVEVVVEGSERVAPKRVLSAAQINVGDTYTLAGVSSAINNLWETGLYSDVKILAEQLPEGLRIIVKIQESPIISKLTVTGNNKIKEQVIKDAIALRVGGLFSPSKVQQSINKIIELYRKKGYYNTQITTKEAAAATAGRIEIELAVREGEKIRITDIVFDGNRAFSNGKLQGAMKTKKKSFLRFWRRGGYDDEKFQKDLTENLPKFYRKNGFLDFQVLNHEMEFKEESKNVVVHVDLDEGRKFYVGNISVMGNTHFPDEIILRAFKLSNGDVFNEEKFEESQRNVQELYADEGYIYLQAQPIQEIRDSVVNVNLAIQEGEPATVRKIIIQGNETTFENVIRRRISIYPGDLFRQPLVKMSYQNLVNSGFFEPDIDIQPRPVSEGGEVDLLFKVKEKRTGTASAGMGFGGGYGLTGFLQLTQSNLFGRGKSIELQLEVGHRTNSIDLSYMDPYLMGTPVSLDVGLFNMRRRYINDPFQDRYKGFYTRFGFPLPWIDYTRLFVGYSLMGIDIRGDSTLVSMYTGANIRDYPQTSSKVSFTLARDTRLNLQHPQSGTRHSLNAEFSGGPFGGNIGYQKYEFDSSWYLPTFRQKFVLGFKVRGGMLQHFGGLKSPLIDPREMYIMGGTAYGRDTDIHLRGYKDREVGVDGRQYSRGNSFFLVTAEEEIMITQQVYAVLFMEAGNVWRDLRDVDISGLRRSAGLGVRMETPMGPLGLEIGYGFDQRDSYGNRLKGRWVPHFRFGRF